MFNRVTHAIPDRKWSRRKRGDIIGRVYSVNTNQGELFYLRLLLYGVAEPISFEHLKRHIFFASYYIFLHHVLLEGLLGMTRCG